jgi:ABC-type branched-subunit amino acid transport system ATPase component
VRSIVGMKPFHITALGMNYVPQIDHVFPSMSVQQNPEVGGMVQRRSLAD